ncbi:hypothetical protein ACOME3_007818 [Neoechinorhynchus agilis]
MLRICLVIMLLQLFRVDSLPQARSFEVAKRGLKDWLLKRWDQMKILLQQTNVKHDLDCGVSDAQQILSMYTMPRVYGGKRAELHAWPWAVSVVNFNLLAGRFQSCGGSLVNVNTVITAAHCVSIGSNPLPTKMLKVIIGAHTLLGQMNLFNYHSVKSIHVHHNYTKCCSNDLAVIKLKSKVKRSPRVNSICLPKHLKVDKKDLNLHNRSAIIAGWGLNTMNETPYSFNSVVLRQGNVTILTDDECTRLYRRYRPFDELCAMNPETFTDARSGDSGGPLMVLEDNRWVLVGVTSHGISGNYQVPGFYSDVRNKMDFITEYL